MRKAVASVHADTVVKSLMRWAGIAADASSPIAAVCQAPVATRRAAARKFGERSADTLSVHVALGLSCRNSRV